MGANHRFRTATAFHAAALIKDPKGISGLATPVYSRFSRLSFRIASDLKVGP